MSTHILRETYNPAKSDIREVLIGSPDAREIYQSTIREFFDSISKIIKEISTPLRELELEFQKLKDAHIARSDKLSSLAEDYNQLVKVTMASLHTKMDTFTRRGIGSSYGFNIPRKEMDILENYLLGFQDKMITMVTHRIRTPMSVLGTSAHILNRLAPEPDDSRIPARIENTERAYNEYREIFAEMKDFFDICYELDRRNEIVELVNVVSIPDIIHDVLAEQEYFQNMDIEILLETEGMVKLDINQFKKAIMQILINSLDFKKEDEDLKIEIRITHEQDSINIYIQDNGIGMDEREVQEAFEPFYTKGMTGIDFTKLPGTGCGLGLSIARGLITRYGEISIKSTKGVGTTVIISLLDRD